MNQLPEIEPVAVRTKFETYGWKYSGDLNFAEENTAKRQRLTSVEQVDKVFSKIVDELGEIKEESKSKEVERRISRLKNNVIQVKQF